MSEPTERFYPSLAIGDESYTFTDADFRARVLAGKPAPTTPECARKLLDRFTSSDDATTPPAFVEEAARRQADAEFAKREADARAAVFAKVFDAMCEVPFVDYGDPDTQGMAEAAVTVFVELRRSPPTREIHPDGAETIRWPGDAS